MQGSTLKTAINFMIYGVKMFLNDVNFSLKDTLKQVVSRLSYPTVFFTNKQKAIIYYKARQREFEGRKGIIYGKYEQRGECVLFVANVYQGRIQEHGKKLMSDDINLLMH